MVPLGSVVQVKESHGPDQGLRYNGYPAADINGGPAPGVSSGQAEAAMERLAAEVLPNGIGYEWTDLTYQQRLAGNTAIFIFPLCVLLVFLVLAAQYESWSLPLAVILIVPHVPALRHHRRVAHQGRQQHLHPDRVPGADRAGVQERHPDRRVRARARQQGRSAVEAALEACRIRLRPILMTSFAFIMGVLPLVFSSGAGAEMRHAMGVAVFSGMLGVTFFGLMLTPVFYVVISKVIEHRRRPEPTIPTERDARETIHA